MKLSLGSVSRRCVAAHSSFATFSPTKTDLCERININGSQINQWATMLNLDPDEYLFELTGWKKPLQARRYFPVLENDQKQGAKTSYFK
ncbi:MAG: hypothetical protein RM368_28950 [Nostoc sp. DedSLP03]|uniref:hypothetical protein n=1 Tax=Nostoc sp. DedSLP03 TaxID=3075400 RepID=UPI002AD57A18|nr:hypothetical protein [Nostoc sp. DedSLP03]MDZ7968934.1 hypothetical protein [Nostoc sp. DedSLP03]